MKANYRRLNRQILGLALPAIASNVTVPLLGLCDTAVTGHLGSAAAIGAVAVGSMMLNVAFWLFGFLRMGTTGLAAQAFGAGDDEGCRRVLTRSALLAAAAGLMLVILQQPLLRLLMFLISPDAEVGSLATSYFAICIWGAPALLVTMSINGWFLGRQNTLWPMSIAIFVNVVNIAVSLILVFAAGMGFTGVAVGTLVANWTGLAVSLVAAGRFAPGRLFCGLRDTFDGGGMSQFFRVNGDIFFRSGCIMAVSLSVTAIGARLGDVTLAANAVMMQFFVFFSYFMDGFAFTGEALCGRYAGSGDKLMLHGSIRMLTLWSAAMAVVFFAAYLFGWEQVVSLITDRPEVRREVAVYKIWLILLPPVTVSAFITDGFFIGLTATRRMLLATLAGALAFFCVAFVRPGMPFDSCVAMPGNSRLWLAFLTYLGVRGILLWVALPGVLRRWRLS